MRESIEEFEMRIDALDKEIREAERREARSVVRAALGNRPLSGQQRDDLVAIISSQIRPGEHGFCGPAGQGVQEFVEAECAARSAMFRPADQNAASSESTNDSFDESLIHPGMSHEEFRRASEAIGKLLTQRTRELRGQ